MVKRAVSDLTVVGAGPAGRAVAHRAAAAGLSVTLVDPDPSRPWQATYGMYSDDAPTWLDESAVAFRSGSFTVFTPGRRVINRGYLVLDPVKFQQSLTLHGVDVVTERVMSLTANSVILQNGSELTSRHVIDARGTVGTNPNRPRQTAFGVFLDPPHNTDCERGDPETVLMDWRPAEAGLESMTPPSFSYRIQTANGRLEQETCLAGRPAIGIDELERRARLRNPAASEDAVVEVVDFPLYGDPRPWKRVSTGPVRFGATGGLMNPATGYSVAQSLGAADLIVKALLAQEDPSGHLWNRQARLTYRLRLIGLMVLLTLRPDDLVTFFDAFFTLSAQTQRAYLSAHDDVGGVLRAMAGVFWRCPTKLKATITIASARATIRAS